MTDLQDMKPRCVKKTTPEQFELLRAEMAIHTAASLGHGSGRDRATVDAEWKDIMVKLNAIGPPFRKLPEWKKVWSDVRLRSKKSLCEEITRNCRTEIDDDILMETLNNASAFYSSNNSLEQNEENNQGFIPPAATEDETLQSNGNGDRGYNREQRMEERNMRKKKTTSEQFKVLKQEMSKHPLAAKGYGTGKDRYKVDAEWKEILEKLNKLGPPYRTMTEWKKVWSDVRLRVRKSLGKPPKRVKGRRRENRIESDSDDDNFLASLNEINSIDVEEVKYTIPVIQSQTEPLTSNDPRQQHHQLKVEKNPLDDNEHCNNNDDTTSYHPDFENDDSQCNDTDGAQTPGSNLRDQKLNALQTQAEQNDKILQHLSKISFAMCGVLQQQVTLLERKNLLLANETRQNDFHRYLQRRHELRRKGRSKISEWF